MRRCTSLVICLLLAFSALPFLTAPVAAQQTLPPEFLGRWQGSALVRSANFETPVTIDLTGGGIGLAAGTVDYPVGGSRTSPCSGVLTLQSVAADERQVTLVENITAGEAACPNAAATVILTLQTDGSLLYDWRHQSLVGDSFAGTLLRAGGASGTSAGTTAGTQAALPAEFVGRWQGTIVMAPDVAAEGPFQPTIDVTGGSVGSVVGTVDYPAAGARANACGGNLALQRVAADGRQVELTVNLTYGQAACSPGATVTLTLQTDGSVLYGWSAPNVQATASGTLRRAGGAMAQGTDSRARAQDATAECASLLDSRASTLSVAGPFYGSLEQGQGMLTRVNAAVTAADFSATATFFNPTSATTVPWEFGFAFHETADQQAVQQILLVSTGTWYYAAWPNAASTSGPAPTFDISPGAANTLDLVVAGGMAQVCLNGQFLTTVALPSAVASDVYIVTGFVTEYIVDGRIIGYQDFEVWPAPTTITRAQQAAPCIWTGAWRTSYGMIRLTQQNDGTVRGDYDWDEGQISGTITGNVLNGMWNEAPSREPPSDAGQLQFTMADDCQSFAGQWRYGSSGAWATDWGGVRVSS